MPSALSVFISSPDGFGFGSTFRLLSSPFFGVGDGVGVGVASFLSLSSVLPFSSSASLPTSFEVESATSFSVANTDAPPMVTIVPPSEIQFFKVETPPAPKPAK